MIKSSFSGEAKMNMEMYTNGLDLFAVYKYIIIVVMIKSCWEVDLIRSKYYVIILLVLCKLSSLLF